MLYPKLAVTLILVVLLIGVSGCTKNNIDDNDDVVTIFAASSLTNAVGDIKHSYEQSHERVDIKLNLAGSKTLRSQIENGAQTDIFLSANEEHFEALSHQNVFESGEAFLTNEMVIVLTLDSKVKVESLNDLTEEFKLVLAQENVPAGDYARKVLKKYSKVSSEKYVEEVLSNLVSEETNVRQVLMKVAMGEADAGIVYKTDVTQSVRDKVSVLEIPSEYNVTGTYYIGLLKGASPISKKVYDYILGQDGSVIFEKYGFDPLN